MSSDQLTPNSEEIPSKRRKLSEDKISCTSLSQNSTSSTNIGADSSSSNMERDYEQVDKQNSSESHKPSESDWKKDNARERDFIVNQYTQNADLKNLIKNLYPQVVIPDDADAFQCFSFLMNMAQMPKARNKLPSVNTLEQAINLIKRSKNIIVLTGAGVSVSCGIPDFRSRNGLYARLAVDFPELTEPSDMFDIDFFRENPYPFFKFAKELYPGNFIPSRCHRFIAQLEKSNKLLRNYSQNIDTLETVAGIKRVMNCHGSFKTATCTTCKHQVNGDEIKKEVFDQVIPRCKICPPNNVEESGNSIEASKSSSSVDYNSFPLQNERPQFVKPNPSARTMKPDIVFFGESLPEEFHRSMTEDKEKVDLFICIGSSLKVHPVAAIPDSIEQDVPQILINRELLRNKNFDINLLGDCDVIVSEISRRLELDDFNSLFDENNKLEEISNEKDLLPEENFKPDNIPLKVEESISKPGEPAPILERKTANQNELPENSEKTPVMEAKTDENSEKNSTMKAKPDELSENSEIIPAMDEKLPSEMNEVLSKSENTSSQLDEAHPNLEESDFQPETINEKDNVNSHGNCSNLISPETRYPQSDNTIGLNGNNNPMTSQYDDDSDDSDCSYDVAAKWRVSLSKQLPNGKFFFDGSHTYVFPGAEVTMDELDRLNECQSDCSSNASSTEEQFEETVKLLNDSHGDGAHCDEKAGDGDKTSLEACKEENSTSQTPQKSDSSA